MKKYITLIILMLAVMLAITAVTVPAYAADDDPAVLDAEATDATEEPAETLVVPGADAVESKVLDAVEKIDSKFAGLEYWESAKEWILTNLSTVVGAIVALATVIVGLSTKFSFVPKIIKSVKQLFTAIGDWCNKNTAALEAMKTFISDFVKDMRKTIEEMKMQANENNDLRHELKDTYDEYIKLRQKNEQLTKILLEATLLDSDELEDLIQLSPLTKAQLDDHYVNYTAKKALITEARDAADVELIEKADDSTGAEDI